jgi:hypothetical protein
MACLVSVGGGGGTPAPFSPSDLSGLILWLDANNAGSITQSGGTVSQWSDLSVNGANFAQSTGSLQPAYTASAINSKPGITFTGSKCLTNSTALMGSGSDPRTIIVVAGYGSTTGFNFLMSFTGPSAGNGPQLGFASVAGYTNIFFGAALTGVFGVVRTSTAFGTAGNYAIGLTYNGSGPGAANYKWYKSNILQTTSTGSDDTYNPLTNILGANDPTGGSSLTGPICEFVIYSRVLNSTELGQMQTYINGKYAL